MSPLGPGHRFGDRVDVSGDHLLVGVPSADTAIFYGWVGGAWSTPGQTTTGAPGSSYAAAVVVDGNHAAIGIPNDSSQGVAGAGAVEIWRATAPGAWTLVTTLYPQTPQVDGDFGAAIDLRGARLVIGSPGHNARRGRVDTYLLDASGTPSAPNAIDPIAAVTAGSEFGYAVAVSGEDLLVGAPFFDNGSFANAGHVTIYRAPNATTNAFTPVTVMNINGSELTLGAALALDGDLAIVSIPALSTGNSPRVQFLERSPGTTAFQIDESTFGALSKSGLGRSVDLSGVDGIVGLPTDAWVGLLPGDDGSARHVKYDGVNFTLETARFQKVPPEPIEFASDVAIDGTRVVIGAARDATGGVDAGAVYTYDFTLDAWNFELLGSTNGGGLMPPLISGYGSGCPGEPLRVLCTKVQQTAVPVLIIGGSYLDVPFQNNTLGPSPDLLIFGLQPDAFGRIDLVANLPPLVPPGTSFYMQYWIDQIGTGFEASTATLKVTTAF